MTKPAPKRYRTTNWIAYNQALIQRGSLSVWLDTGMSWQATPQGKRGRTQTYSDVAIQFCLTIKNLFGLPLRQTIGFIQSLLKLAGLGWAFPTTARCQDGSRRCRSTFPIRKVLARCICWSIAPASRCWVKASGKPRSMARNIAGNGAKCIWASMRKPCKSGPLKSRTTARPMRKCCLRYWRKSRLMSR